MPDFDELEDFDALLAAEKKRLEATQPLVELPDIPPNRPALMDEVIPHYQSEFDPEAYAEAMTIKAEEGAFGDLVSDKAQVFEDAPQVSGIEEIGGKVWVPAMSQDEYEKGLAPRGKRMVPVPITPHTDKARFKLLLTNAYAQAVSTGIYTIEGIAKSTGISVPAVQRVVNSPEFRYALKLRGVSTETQTGLTEEQMNALVILSDSSNGTMQQRYKRAQITPAKHRLWLKQPAYRQQWETMYEDALSDNGNALVMLDTLVDNGDFQALKFKLELTGRYNPNRQQNIDVMAIMGKMLEIIQARVKDPAILQGIADDVTTLVQDLPRN